MAHFLFLLILCSTKIERLLFLKFLKNLAFFDSYFWPFYKSEEKIKVIFVISSIMPSIWNVFIKFRWHDEKLIVGSLFIFLLIWHAYLLHRKMNEYIFWRLGITIFRQHGLIWKVKFCTFEVNWAMSMQFTKYSNFLEAYSFFWKNQANFVPAS